MFRIYKNISIFDLLNISYIKLYKMKKIILMALVWPICSYPLYAQKGKTINENREIIKGW